LYRKLLAAIKYPTVAPPMALLILEDYWNHASPNMEIFIWVLSPVQCRSNRQVFSAGLFNLLFKH
jgi:hypothetical protein